MVNIIGGAGFIGNRLCSVLSQRGVEFRIFDKQLVGSQFVDVAVPESFSNMPKANAVINLAAEHRDDVTPRSRYDEVNVDGARNVCNYCRTSDINTIVFTSSVAVYGFAPEGTSETGALNPFNDYGRTKMEAEQVYREWLAEDPARRSLIIVRPTVVFGEDNRGNVYNLVNQIAKKRFVMIGPGTNKKSMAYVQNVAEFLAHSLTFSVGEHVYNYVDTPDMDMNQFVSTCRSYLFGREDIGLRLPIKLGLLIGRAFDIFGWAMRRQFPINSIRVRKFTETTAFVSSATSTGFEPSTPLKQSLERFISSEFL